MLFIYLFLYRILEQTKDYNEQEANYIHCVLIVPDDKQNLLYRWSFILPPDPQNGFKHMNIYIFDRFIVQGKL